MNATTNPKAVTLHRVMQTPDVDFLLFLGKRVRLLRNLRGMTRKMVAREADVSERHLAQLEAGEGNVSIVLLRRIAGALNVSLVELFAPEVEEPAGKQMIQRFLERLPNHRLEDVVLRLMRDFSPGEQPSWRAKARRPSSRWIARLRGIRVCPSRKSLRFTGNPAIERSRSAHWKE